MKKTEKEYFDEYFGEELTRLKNFTSKCRPDMHEPDEQGLDAIFGPSHLQYGSNRNLPPCKVRLDNACSHEPTTDCPSSDMGFWLVNEETNESQWFNLANIIALARMAKP